MGNTRLGFDIGSSSLKIAVLRGAETRIEEVRLPENMVDGTGAILLPHAFAQFLKQTKKDLSLPRGPAALALPPSQVICRLVTMPRMTTEQLLLNLPYEFSDFIQGVADQYHCDYAVCVSSEEDDEAQGVPMMAAVAAKQTLAEYARMFSQAGLRLKTVLPQEMALIQLCQARGAGAEEFCFVDLGHQFTRITVVWRDRVQATRQIALGGRNLDMIVAGELGVDPFLSNTYKAANFQNVLTLPAVAEVCERIAVEILKVINFYQFTYRSSSLEGVYLVGGGAALPLLRQSIESAVGLPLLDPADLLPEAGDAAASAGVFAAGAAMGGK
ncbi:MAG: pilus assembly protein PilM [Oscillibacter sp.]|nr:pilus assembly protein PilM [Oscillibacter sp.]